MSVRVPITSLPRGVPRPLSLAIRLTFLGICLFAWSHESFAQQAPLTLVERYRQARLQVQVDSILQVLPPRLPFRGPVYIETPADTLRAWIAQWARRDTSATRVSQPTLDEGSIQWKLYSRLERPIFEAEHEETLWSFLGSTRYRTVVDTIYTSHIRARLQAAFGAPTRTVVELPPALDRAPGDYIQFEYWFVLNDSIPLKVTDVNGPLDRGVVVASDHRYRNILFQIRQAFLAEVVTEGRPAAFTDYYFHYETQRWYRAGFTGEQYFVDRIRPPRLDQGRPRLEQPSG